MSGLASALLAVSLLAAAPVEAAEHTVAGLSFEAPEDAEVAEEDQGSLPEQVRVVRVTRGAEVLLLTVYGGDDTPTVRRARSIHTEELERMATRQADRIETGSFDQRILGRSGSGREVRWTQDGAAVVGRVVAGHRSRHTVVAAWLHPADMDAPMSPDLVSSLRLADD